LITAEEGTNVRKTLYLTEAQQRDLAPLLVALAAAPEGAAVFGRLLFSTRGSAKIEFVLASDARAQKTRALLETIA
jgi:hypothetical protein